jgi:phosphoribosyl-AMP cyclohydrolase
MKTIESTTNLTVDFKKLSTLSQMDVVPVVVQHFQTKEVLILAYINEIALQRSINEKKAIFWSTSRNELWVKGATSGDYLFLKEVRVNCEQNSLLFLVTPKGTGVCHTKDIQGAHRPTCYYRTLGSDTTLTFC